MTTLNLSIDIPEEKVEAAIDAVAYQFGYKDFLEDDIGEPITPNPQTKPQFIKAHILHVVKSAYKSYNDAQAVAGALDAQPEDGSDFS